jgi:hypothetical protein
LKDLRFNNSEATAVVAKYQVTELELAITYFVTNLILWIHSGALIQNYVNMQVISIAEVDRFSDILVRISLISY